MRFLLIHLTVCCLLYLFGAERTTAQRSEYGRTITRELFNSLEELSRIVDISYCVGHTGIWRPFECLSRCDKFQDFELITAWNTGPLMSDSCGYIALSHPPSPKRIIVAFRGTHSLANTVVDLSAYLQPYIPYKGAGNDTGKLGCSNCTVHAGFMASWQNARSIVLPYLLAARKQHPDYKFVLVGHSLGGAVAALAGLEMHLRGWDPQVTTFGEPRVGNEAFVTYLDERFELSDLILSDYEKKDNAGRSSVEQSRFRRVTHVNDPVPLLPLEELGYKMHGGEIFISKLDLPPSISDVEVCDGDQDPRCIAQSDALRLLLHELNESRSVDAGQVNIGNPDDQVVLSDERRHRSMMSSEHSNSASLTSSGIPWPLIPSKFKLWELFLAHRDYFWRLGLCFPGGDPTKFRDMPDFNPPSVNDIS